MDRRVWIGAAAADARGFGGDDAVVVVDVIRAMTTAVTALALGGRCFPVPSLEAAWVRAGTLRHPLLVGELGGRMPDGFDLSNSPAKIARRRDLHERPMVLLSSSGTPLLAAVAGAGAVYAACLRNWRAVADEVAARHRRVTILGATSCGQFREEDQLCCAYIAGRLTESGFAAGDAATAAGIARWSAAPPTACLGSKSVRYLRATRQGDDLAFILRHIDDLDALFRLDAGELVRVPTAHTTRAVG